ncbi:MAG: response regulator [Planctomycetes bacterium]|nr:response regulator [Planctomycetota bacterium]MCH8967547.1 response regulator [Planctomycetota bacterium]
MNRKKILIVDDDRQVSLALSIRLKAADYDVDVAGDGENALEKLTASVPDVVLLDMRMPGIDGLEVMRRMKQDPRLANIPVIFVSANAQETAKRAALNAGGKIFLEKPFESRALLEAIQRVLEQNSGVTT